MDRAQVHETINQLVETYHDQHQARGRLTQFLNSAELPREPDKFPNLLAFLAFHEERRRYEDRLLSIRTEGENLDKAYREAERKLRDILPQNVPQHYDYEGKRQEFAGVQFTITNQHLSEGRTQITISSSRPADE
jgi:hypothetical protein